MSKTVTVSLPANVTPHEAATLQPYLSYKFPSDKVRYIRNGFITNSGLVCNSRGLIKECCHYDWEGQPEVCYAEVLGYYRDTEHDPENLLMFDDNETYLIIHNRWQVNYYHWLTEAIYRLWLVKDKSHQMVLLLPSKEQLSSIALESLKPFHFKNIVYIPIDKSVQVRRLCLPPQKPKMESYNAKALLHISKHYTNYLNGNAKIKVHVGDKVFLSREKSRWRKIHNEQAVVDILIKYDFQILYSEDYTFFEQVSLFSNVKYLVASHGAGLTNMLFMQPGSTVFELVKRKTNPVRHQSELFWYMADALGHKYYLQICEPVDADELFFKADIVVDTSSFEKNLESIFHN